MPTEPEPPIDEVRDDSGASSRPTNANTGEHGTSGAGTSPANTPGDEGERGEAKGRDRAARGDKSGKSAKRKKRGESSREVDPTDRQQLVALGARIRELRQARGYKSQLAFVLEAGLPRSYYGDIERGQTNPTIYTLLAIARALGVRLPDLFVPSGEVPFAATTPQGPPSLSPTPGGRIEPFPFRQAQRHFRYRKGADGIPPFLRPPLRRPGSGSSYSSDSDSADARGLGSTGSGSSGSDEVVEPPQVASSGEDPNATKAKRQKKHVGTLISTAAVARAFGVNVRTIERWVDAGKLLPWDWVDGRLVVFRDDEIAVLAKEYREYLALRSQLISAEGAEGTGAIVASKALKRLLKRLKRQRLGSGKGRPAGPSRLSNLD